MDHTSGTVCLSMSVFYSLSNILLTTLFRYGISEYVFFYTLLDILQVFYLRYDTLLDSFVLFLLIL